MFRRRNEQTDRRLKPRSTGGLTVQPLENRQLMAAGFGFEHFNWTPEIYQSGANIEIKGTLFADHATAVQDTKGTADVSDDQIRVSLTTNGQTIAKTYDLYNAQGDLQINRIVFRGNQNNDKFFNHTGVTSTAYGGSGNDLLQGGSNVDYFYGQSGDDILIGKGGADRLSGGADVDVIIGGDEADRIWGDAGNDILSGNDGDDTIYGGDGHDTIRGGSGDDNLKGERDSDRIYGDNGDDKIDGGSHRDYLYGGNHNDVVRGGSGNDRVHGNAGNDSVLGDSGRDYLYGNDGNDLLDGGSGDDHLFGGNHDDILFGGDGSDVVHGEGGDDFLAGGLVNFHPNGTSSFGDKTDWNMDYLKGGEGRDTFLQADHIPLALNPTTSFMDVVYATSEDVVKKHWFAFNTGIVIDFDKYGHLYDGPIH